MNAAGGWPEIEMIQPQMHTDAHRWSERNHRSGGHRRPARLWRIAAEAPRICVPLWSVFVASLTQCSVQVQRGAMRRDHDDMFRFITRHDVPCTNNASERAPRPSVIFRKVTGGFRAE